MRRWEGKTYDVYSPIRRQGSDEPIFIGRAPLQTGAEALAAVQAAAKVRKMTPHHIIFLVMIF